MSKKRAMVDPTRKAASGCASGGIAARRRTTLVLAIGAAFASGAALAECPPPKSEAQHVAAGAVVFTGKVRALGPSESTGRPDYADFDVSEGPEHTIRVYAPNNGLYTAVFRLGEIRRVVAYRGERGLETHLCFSVRP